MRRARSCWCSRLRRPCSAPSTGRPPGIRPGSTGGPGTGADRVRARQVATTQREQGMTDLWRLSAADLATLIRSKQVSATEAAHAALARLDAVNPGINAVVDHRPE